MRNDLAKLTNTYTQMFHRCYTETSISYPNYGKRGIRICDEWLKSPGAFLAWAIEVCSDTTGLQIDRVDNDGPYSPDNCRWVSKKENNRNRRVTKLIEAWGEKKNAAEWAEDERCPKDLSWKTISKRVALGIDPEIAISKSIKEHKENRYERTSKSFIENNDPIRHMAFEENKTVAEWSKDPRAVVSKKVIWQRINAGWSVEDAITKPANNNRGLIFEGKTISEWSRSPDCKVSYGTLARRLKSGMPVEQALV